MTIEAQTQQLTGFQQTYSHHTKIEENSKGEARITVSIYSNDIETAKNECLKLYNQLYIVLRPGYNPNHGFSVRTIFFGIQLRSISVASENISKHYWRDEKLSPATWAKLLPHFHNLST
jgi:hypothetical protein